MKRKILRAGIISGGLLLLIIGIAVKAGAFKTAGTPGLPQRKEKGGSGDGISDTGAELALASMMGAEISDEKRRGGIKDRESEFSAFRVVDGGEILPDNQKYTGLTCSWKDSLTETISVRLGDGSVREEEVSTLNLNNIWFSVPKGGTRCFGVPIFSTEYYTEGEREQKEEWDDVEGIDCPEFNEGMEKARELIREGYLQYDLEKFLLRFPELNPTEREYTLRLTRGGRTDREDDDTSWWELYYILSTTAENGEVVPVATLDITKIIKAQGFETTDDAHLRIWTAGSGYWRLLEDGTTDLGEIWISQIPEMDFSEEDKTRSYVEKMGVDFDLLLPAGADRKIQWSCREEKVGWYNYLIWTGDTDTYEITLAIPLMEPDAGGWYLASRIRKEARKKEMCGDTLLTMMQTFHLEDSFYIVREGDTLWEIYKRYMKETDYNFREFVRYNEIRNSGLIYPGQKVRLTGR